MSLEGINNTSWFTVIISYPGERPNEQEQTKKGKEFKSCKDIRISWFIILTLNMAST